VDGAPVILQSCNGVSAQKWTFADGAVKVFGNKCLDVTSGVNQDGTKIQIWTCLPSGPNQHWDYNRVCFVQEFTVFLHADFANK